jgi:hypothetical protein
MKETDKQWKRQTDKERNRQWKRQKSRETGGQYEKYNKINRQDEIHTKNRLRAGHYVKHGETDIQKRKRTSMKGKPIQNSWRILECIWTFHITYYLRLLRNALTLVSVFCQQRYQILDKNVHLATSENDWMEWKLTMVMFSIRSIRLIEMKSKSLKCDILQTLTLFDLLTFYETFKRHCQPVERRYISFVNSG